MEEQLMLNLADAEQAPTLRDLGEVFTRPWVVELILDLVGYTHDRNLAQLRIVEPSCGDGAFLGPIIDRLLRSRSSSAQSLADLVDAVRAFDLSPTNVEAARKLVVARLMEAGHGPDDAQVVADKWVQHADFLLTPEVREADFVVGNPPYLRPEAVPADRTAAYRAVFSTMRGRSDIYVGFIQRGLSLLRPGAALGFIVADRWMHNQYGSGLRELIARDFSVDAVIEMHEADAFESEVSAYPAITIIRRKPQAQAVMVTADTDFDAGAAEELIAWVSQPRRRLIAKRGFRGARMDAWFPGNELWPSGDPARIAVLRDLEARFPPLERADTGTRVGIGVASGADAVYVTNDVDVVEEDRLLPLVRSTDITTGEVQWGGAMLINPWDADGLVDLRRYPRLARYLRQHGGLLKSRHVARRRPTDWYRTIDRVEAGLLGRPKLLLPDMKAASHPVLESGCLYPHHNLYFVTSDLWDLEVLGGLLLSDVANLFVGAYCVKMRGGTYRFQAQYLRRIRVPDPAGIRPADRRALARAFTERDVEAATAAACRAYMIDPSDLNVSGE